MDRRQFLGVSTAGMGSLLGGSTISFVRRNLGIGPGTGVVAPDPRTASPPRATTLWGRVENVDGTSVTIELTPREASVDGRLVVRRRGYPAGEILNEAVSDPFGLRRSTSEPIEVVVDVPRMPARSGPWFYECLLQHRGTDELAFVCESAPFRWSGRRAAVPRAADRVVDDPPSIKHDRFERRLSRNDYVVAYAWRDSTPTRWSLTHRLRRSVHEAAVDRERGYVQTFEESLSSPVVRRLADAIATRAWDVPDDGHGRSDADDGQGNDGQGNDGGRGRSDADDRRENVDEGSGLGRGRDTSISPAERFDRLVRFAQDIRYERDFESMDVYDYNRTVEETLVDGVGDCKDKSFLLAGLLAAPPLSCDVVLCFQPAHVLLGVAREDVPDGVEVHDTVVLGGREYVPVDPSFRFRIGEYPDADVTAAYGDGRWLHADAGAIGRGLERNVRDFLENGVRK